VAHHLVMPPLAIPAPSRPGRQAPLGPGPQTIYEVALKLHKRAWTPRGDALKQAGLPDDEALPLIEEALARRPSRSFGPSLERQYEARRGPARRGRMAIALSVTAAGVMAASALDWVDGLSRLGQAVAWRAGLAALCLLCAALLRRAAQPWQESLLFCLPCVGVMLVIEVLGQRAPAQFVDRYMVVAIISGVALLVSTPVRLATAIGAGLASAAAFPVALALVPGPLVLQANWDMPAFALGAFAVGAVVVHRHEASRRTSFLHTLRHEHAAREMGALNAELLRLSSTDTLTGLGNRRQFDAEARRLWDDGRGPGLGVALIDVDHFKSFNDAAGHEAGDTCLREVARAIGCALREEDRASRYGGEEFVVLLPCTGREEVAAVGERLRASVQALGLPHPGQGGTPVTVSVGLAWRGTALRSGQWADLLREADQALYAAKRAGRNRVLHADGAAGSGTTPPEAAARTPQT